MTDFNFKRRNVFSGPHLFGTLLIFAGVFAFLSPLLFESYVTLEKTILVGAIFLVIGLMVVLTYGGTMINFTEKRVKEYTSVCGHKFGDWIPLPGIFTVKVISTRYKVTNTPNGISPTLSGSITVFKVLLWSEDQAPEFSFIYTNKERAIHQAKQLAAGLNASLELRLSKE